MRAANLAILGVVLAAFGSSCNEPFTVATEDVVDEGGGGATDADGRDVEADRRDVEEEEFIFADGEVTSDAPPAAWTAADCEPGGGGALPRVMAEGHTGDACVFGATCEVMSLRPDELSHFATCDTVGRLITGSTSCRWCTAPAAEPWTDCAAALAGGGSGQACSGTWSCAARDPDDRCCILAAECGDLRDARYWALDVLGVTRLCLKDCPTTPFPDRPSYAACPAPRTVADPEPLLGDECTGDWACMAPRDAFAAPLTFTSSVPAWCADGVLMVSSVYGCRSPCSTCE
jgi:hypothetical protein